MGLVGAQVCAVQRQSLSADPVGLVRSVLSVADERLDYARAKLALDKVICPDLDEAAALKQLEQLARAARRMAGAAKDGASRLGAVRRTLFDAGPWNKFRPFTYDHADPLGRHLPNKLLHLFLKRRLGQCVSMPILYLILADRLGLDVVLGVASDHFFLRYTAPNGREYNLEATSGGHPARTEWYRTCFPMSERSIRSGLYMRTLTRRETLAMMTSTVMEHLRAERRWEELIAVCNLALEVDPRFGFALLVAGSAYAKLMQREFPGEYPMRVLVPEHRRARRLFLAERNHALIAAAERLGWEPGS